MIADTTIVTGIGTPIPALAPWRAELPVRVSAQRLGVS